MRDASGDEDVVEDEQFTAQPTGPQRNLRAEREEKLRLMMEEDDEDSG